jgi:cytochrome c553
MQDSGSRFLWMMLPAALVAAGAPVFAQQPPDKTKLCAPCHGENGNSTVPQYPIIAGQTSRYLYLELKDYKAGRRHGPLMEPVAKELSEDDMRALADYYSKQTWKPSPFKADPAKVEAGRKKADQVLCPMCHLNNFMGQNEIPRVGGQHYEYVKKQLTDFREKRRTNDAGVMRAYTSGLSDQDIENLAQYLANLS